MSAKFTVSELAKMMGKPPKEVLFLLQGIGVDVKSVESVLDPTTAQGLEFDAVVVVEPAQIVRSSDHGTRLLYVALTRAVQHLVVAHAEPLPEPLNP